jgi:hypothetical protein
MTEDWESYRFDTGACLHCGIVFDGLTGPKGGPDKGSLMVCASCAYVSEWDGEKFVELSEETMKEASANPDFATLLDVTRKLRALPRMPDRVLFLEPRAPEICQDCGRLKELRPYGLKVDGKRQWVCFDCSQKNPAEANAAFDERIEGTNPVDREPDGGNRAGRRRAASRRRR